jgi:hypothetical protein
LVGEEEGKKGEEEDFLLYSRRGSNSHLRGTAFAERFNSRRAPRERFPSSDPGKHRESTRGISLRADLKRMKPPRSGGSSFALDSRQRDYRGRSPKSILESFESQRPDSAEFRSGHNSPG